jgi:Ca2+-binding RTX toxin-like protein
VKLEFDRGIDGDPSDGMLLVDMNLHEALDTKLGLDITVSPTLPNLTSAGVLKVNGTLDVDLGFGIDLKHPNQAWLFDDSSIAADVHVEGEAQVYEVSGDPDGKDGMGLVFRASLGPLAVFIQDGDALIDAAFALPGLEFGTSDRKLLSTVAYADWLAPDISENYAEIVLPMFYGGEGPDDYLDDFWAKGALVDDPATLDVEGPLAVFRPDFSDIEADIENGDVEYDPFENILLGIDTLNLYLELLSDTLAGDVLGTRMPFVGDQMADVLFIENFRQNLYSTLKSGIENDIDPTPADVTALLTQALGGYLKGVVAYDGYDPGEPIVDWNHQWNFTLEDTVTVIFEDFDLGIPHLGFDTNIPVQAELKWTISLGFGLNFVEGAYIDVSDVEDLDLNLKITLLPQPDSKATLGFLKGPVTDPGNDTGAVLNFDVDVTNDKTDKTRLGFADIGKIDLGAKVVGESLGEAASTDPTADTNVVTLHLATVALSGLPALEADLVLDWALPAGTKVGDLKGNAVTPDLAAAGVDHIALMDMKIDTGSIAESLLQPLLGTILDYIEPFMPVVDVLTAPIPVLSDLSGEPFTLLDLAAIFGSVDSEFIDAVADILDVISMLTDAMNAPVLPLGDIVLFDRDSGIASFDPYDVEDRLVDVDLLSAPGLVVDGGFNASPTGNDFLDFIRSDPPPVKGLSTPIYTDPLQAIGLFLNQNAVMIDYQLPPLGVEFEYLQVFPIWGPLAVSIEIGFGFNIDLHSIGFDTYGYQRYADGGYRNPAIMFDGFYFNDLDTDGVDAPEVTFEFGLVGAAELNLGIARAGVGGGINASIFFDWHDAIPDGFVHLSELEANVLSADPGPNPLAVFDIGGALTFQLFAFLEISLLGIEEEFPITPETELFSFNESFDHDPILATKLGDGILQINIGPNARDRVYDDITDGSESITVEYDGDTVYVYSDAFGVDKGSLINTFTGITKIVGIGGQGDDVIDLELDGSGIAYELDGGLGDDTITVTGGTGQGVIVGGVGNDTLTGGDGNDEIYGGEGNDVIKGSGGYDILFGDQGRVVDSAFVTTPYITSRVTAYDGVDEIKGGDADDVIIGAGGDDLLWGDAGNDIVIGDGGRFEFEWITNSDPHVDVAKLRPVAYDPAEIVTTDPDTPAEISAGIDAVYDALMADFHATDLFYGGNDEIHGGADHDMLFGGSGDDRIEGDAGDDMVLAGKGFDEVFGGTFGTPIVLDANTTDKDTLFGGDQADVISGNEDVDVIAGGSGNDYIHGNSGDDVMKGDSGADVMFGDDGNDQLFGLTEPDILFGGVGNDLVVGGTGNDTMFGDDGLVAKLDPNDGKKSVKIIYNDLVVVLESKLQDLLDGVIAAESDYVDDDVRTIDLVLTYLAPGDGDDYLSGEAADDLMLGGGGNDLMGGDVDPRLPGMPQDGGEPLPTPISEDVMIGDGGMITFDQRRFRSISSVIVDPLGVVGPDGNFDDTLYGDNGNDYLLGGWGSDYLFGGHGRVVDITQGHLGVGVYRGPTDEGASDADILFGDNGRLDFAAYSDEHPDNFGLLTKAHTTDTVETTGADDYAEGELDNDIVFGGVNNDDATGDEEVDRLFGHEGRDVVLGDNGMVEFDLDPGVNLGTLDRVRSYLDKLGGTDEVSGSEAYDLLMGGTGGDRMYGDDVTATSGSNDGSDIMLGDNGQVDLLDAADPDHAGSGTDLLVFFGGAVVTVNTTDGDEDFGADLNDATTGGVDFMYGNYDDDRMAGGAWGDFLYGSVGDDLILGDAARFEWLYDGSSVTPFELSQNDLLGSFDTSFTTLDLVTTKQPTFGARDTIDGEAGEDTAFGGTDADLVQGGADDDILFGDHGHFYPQHSTLAEFASRNFFAIDWMDDDGGDGDVMYGNAGDDSMVGQQGDDRMWGGTGDDDMAGGHNVPTGIDEITTGNITATLNPPVNDLMDGGAGNDAMAGDNAIIWRRGDSVTPDDLSPRFQVLTESTIYTTNTPTDDTITVNVDGTWRSDPADADGRDITLIDHSDTIEAMPAGARPFGNDIMAGGSESDVMFGELANDLMQGDGAIETTPVVQHTVTGYPAFISRTITVDDAGGAPDTDQTLYFNIPERASDADDYLEGNGGSDLMYGGLGQDDMIGGSSALFGLTSEELRPDTVDVMYGGAGIATTRNDIGATSFGLASEDGQTHVITTLANGHSRDADFMMGDNANVYRLVNAGTDAFLRFNYDANYGLRIIPRAMEQLDYTLGGGDFDGAGYNALGQAKVTDEPADNGAADLMHGESGDDVIFGMTGSDVLFGEGQDDDIVGGYGHDWISGGTGQDGVLGDDGLLYTSRNSVDGEPLYGIAPLLDKDGDPRYSNGNALGEYIATPGSIQTATINVAGELKKTADLVPFSFDATWRARDDEFPNNADAKPYADDIVFGGLGSDWLHGGSGDDAISGAEALEHAYVPSYDAEGSRIGRIDLGYGAVGVPNELGVTPTQQNPGNVLFFHPEDADGRHLNNRFRAGEFDLYDEYNPRQKILLDTAGKPNVTTGADFLLNFAKGEGVVRPAGTVPKATGQQTENYPQVNDDGADAIFGDLGNDWIVGGTGRDNLYGGWGNDYLQADDNLDTETTGVTALYDNESPDTHPTFEDRAYGGAGRDVLVGNTGGDRLIDWVGEYNSYLVPYAPFGQASVSRTLQPFLPEFLYALSAGDGADPTRFLDVNGIGTPLPQPTNNNPIPSRFGEPAGELGLVLQKDFAWGDQTGAPADPQAGNIPGGPRDVLRSADFAGNNPQGFVAESGTWKVANNRYEVAPLAGSANRDAISLFNSDVTVPSYFELTATINAVKAVAGFKANAYIVFDYHSPTDFKFAGINISTNKIEIGQRASWGFQVLASTNMLLKADIDYNVLLAINGTAVTLVVNNAQSVSYAFQPRRDADGFTYNLNAGMYGLGADNGRARIDNVVVQQLPPKITYAATDTFAGAAPTLLTPYDSSWAVQAGRFVGTPSAGAPYAIAVNDIAVRTSAMLKLDAVLSTSGVGGVVFDLYSPTDFKWAAVSKATNQVMLGHYTAKDGWVVDAAVTRTIAAGDSTLSVTLKGTTASVSLNGQAVLSRVYNAAVVDGAVGTFSRGGTTSFDSFTLQTDDARFAAATAQSVPQATALSAATSPGPTAPALIEWQVGALSTAVAPAPASNNALSWLEDFVNHGGRPLVNANANLRVRV